MADLARDGLANLQQRMLRAAVGRRDIADLDLQRDTVEGARRLEVALRERLKACLLGAMPREDWDACWAAWREAEQYLTDAEAALARYEQRPALGAPPPVLETGG